MQFKLSMGYLCTCLVLASILLQLSFQFLFTPHQCVPASARLRAEMVAVKTRFFMSSCVEYVSFYKRTFPSSSYPQSFMHRYFSYDSPPSSQGQEAFCLLRINHVFYQTYCREGRLFGRLLILLQRKTVSLIINSSIKHFDNNIRSTLNHQL